MEKIENPRNKNAKSAENKRRADSLYGEIRRNRSAYYMMTPFFVLFFVFTVLPIMIALPMAFADFRIPGALGFAGIENFRDLFSENDLFASALKNTLLSLLITGLGGFVLSVLAAWLISLLRKRLKTVFAVIFFLPTLLYGAFAVWGMVLGDGMSSPLNSVLMSLGMITDPVDWLDRPPASFLLVQLLRLWGTFGIGFLAVLAGFDEAAADREMYEAGRIDGLSNRFQDLIFITIPAAAPRLALAAALQIAAAFSAGSVFTTTPANMTLTDYMLTLGTDKFDVGMASAVGVLITAAASLIYFVVRKLLRVLNG